MQRTKKTLDHTHRPPRIPEPIPTDPEELLDLMDDAANYAAAAQGATAPAFDHGMRIFNQLNARFQIQAAREMADAHRGLIRATNGLNGATWWLAGVTIALGAVEVFGLFHAR